MSFHQPTKSSPTYLGTLDTGLHNIDRKLDLRVIQQCLVSSGYSFSPSDSKEVRTWMWSLLGDTPFTGFLSEDLAVYHAWIGAQEGAMDVLLPDVRTSTRGSYLRSLSVEQKIRLVRACYIFGEPPFIAPLPDGYEMGEIREHYMSDWQAGDSVPATDGVYLRDFGDGEATSYFRNGKWRRDGFFASPEQALPWRGLIMRPPLQPVFS